MKQLRRSIKEVVMAGMCLVMAASCHWGGTVFHQCRAVDGDGWQRSDTLLFELPVLPKQKEVDFLVDVRYTGEFPYRHLWLVIQSNVTDSLLWQTDTLCCTLYDEKGNFAGTGMAGVYQVEVPLATCIPDGSSCARVQIGHCVNDESVKGIMDVGIRVKE